MPVPKLTRTKVLKVRRLLDMMYKPSEIAEELEITTDTIYRSYLPAGAPCQKDSKGQVWIHGLSFANWARAFVMSNARRKGTKMEDNQVYCMRCNQVVQPESLRMGRPNGHGVANVSGKCPNCGSRVNRFLKA
jgi:hypothetical protein